MTLRIFTIVLACFLVGCSSHYLVVHKVKVDKDSLASTFARSPDPLQGDPPAGERLFVNWVVPKAMSTNGYSILLSVIYRDLSEESITHPIHFPTGTMSFSLVGEKFTKTKGFYSYKAELLDPEGKTVHSWQHIMWVNIAV